MEHNLSVVLWSEFWENLMRAQIRAGQSEQREHGGSIRFRLLDIKITATVSFSLVSVNPGS